MNNSSSSVSRYPLNPAEVKRAISLTEAAKMLRGRGGKAPHLTTVRRWADPKRGFRSGGGPVVVLRAVKIGCDVVTLPEWVEEFQAARIRPLPAMPRERSARSARAAHRRAVEELRRAGC